MLESESSSSSFFFVGAVFLGGADSTVTQLREVSFSVDLDRPHAVLARAHSSGLEGAVVGRSDEAAPQPGAKAVARASSETGSPAATATAMGAGANKKDTVLRRTLSGPRSGFASGAAGGARGRGKQPKTAHDHYHRDVKLVDSLFLSGGDYAVALTADQLEHYSLIFDLNDVKGDGHLKVVELANFLDSLGHGVPASELEKMITDLGIHEDADGSITRDAFLEFMRRTLVADLPASRLKRIHDLFEATAALSPRSPVSGEDAGVGARWGMGSAWSVNNNDIERVLAGIESIPRCFLRPWLS